MRKSFSVATAISLVALSFSAVLPSSAAGSETCGELGAVIQRPQGWTTVTLPQPEVEDHDHLYDAYSNATGTPLADPIRRIAFDPMNPDVFLVASHHDVLRSTDGGCTWQTVFQLPEPDLSQQNSSISVGTLGAIANGIVDLDIVGQRAYLTIGSAPRVFISDKGGGSGSWSEADHPDTVALAPSLEVAPSDPQTAYMMVNGGQVDDGPDEVTKAFLFVTNDGGATWSEASRFYTGQDSARHWVDPVDAGTVWVAVYRRVVDGGATLFRSTDGGKNFEELVGLPGGSGLIGDLDLVRPRGKDATIVLEVKGVNGDYTVSSLYRSSDGGASWKEIVLPRYSLSADAFMSGSPDSMMATVIIDPGYGASHRRTLQRYVPPRGGRGVGGWAEIMPPHFDYSTAGQVIPYHGVLREFRFVTDKSIEIFAPSGRR